MLCDYSTGQIIIERLEVADGFWSRLVGLQFRRGLPIDAGLLLVSCSSIHTCWMRFPIDLVCLDSRGKVLAVKPRIRPWRIAISPRDTYAVLELAAGRASEITIGNQFTWRTEGSEDVRPSLRFLSRTTNEINNAPAS